METCDADDSAGANRVLPRVFVSYLHGLTDLGRNKVMRVLLRGSWCRVPRKRGLAARFAGRVWTLGVGGHTDTYAQQEFCLSTYYALSRMAV